MTDEQTAADAARKFSSVGEPPQPQARERIRRRWRSLRSATRLAILYIAPLFFIGSLAMARSVIQVGWPISFDILVGAASASEKGTGAWGMVLAAVGYLIIPALASIMIASLWEGPSREQSH